MNISSCSRWASPAWALFAFGGGWLTPRQVSLTLAPKLIVSGILTHVFTFIPRVSIQITPPPSDHAATYAGGGLCPCNAHPRSWRSTSWVAAYWSIRDAQSRRAYRLRIITSSSTLTSSPSSHQKKKEKKKTRGKEKEEQKKRLKGLMAHPRNVVVTMNDGGKEIGGGNHYCIICRVLPPRNPPGK